MLIVIQSIYYEYPKQNKDRHETDNDNILCIHRISEKD